MLNILNPLLKQSNVTIKCSRKFKDISRKQYYSTDINYESWKSDLPDVKYKKFVNAVKNDQFQNANTLFKELSTLNYNTNWTYVTMIKYLREKKLYNEALEVYYEADKNIKEPSTPLIVQLITLLLESNHISECSDLIDILEEDTSLKKNSFYYSATIRLYSGLGNIEKAMNAYQNITGNRNIAIECLIRYSQRFSFLPSSNDTINFIIDELTNNEYDERAHSQILRSVKVDHDILSLLKECDIKFTPALFLRLSRECAQQEDIELNFKIYNTCYQLGFVPQPVMINEMLSVLNKCKKPEEKAQIVKVFDLMKIEKKKHKYSPKIFNVKAMTGIFANHEWNDLKESDYVKYIKLKHVDDKILSEWFSDMDVWVDQFCKKNNLNPKYDFTSSLLSE